MKNVRFGLIVIALISVFALAACAGSTTATEEVVVTEEAAPEPVAATVTMVEFAFDPASLTVAPGTEVTITGINNGALLHTYYVMEAGYEAVAPWDDEDESHILYGFEVQPNEEGEYTFTAPTEPGTYQVACDQPGHLEGGMVGTLVVEGE